MIAEVTVPEARAITIPYTPRPLQQEFHDVFERVHPRASLLCCHRRFGKSVMTVNALIKAALTCNLPSPRFAFIAPFLKQAKDIAWDYVHQFAGVVPRAQFNESELRVDFPGDRRVRLYGADNPDSIQGIYLDGVVMDEYQLTSPRLFGQIVRPMLADRRGWVIFAGKPMGRNHFYDLFRAMQSSPARLVRLYRASETGVLSQDELEDMRIGPPPMTEDQYAQELECSWEAAIEGAYYAREMEAARASGRITSLTWEPTIPVDTWWDLGYSDATAIICGQRVGRELHILDYIEATGQGLAYYARELHRRPYLYGRHYLPHDAGRAQQALEGKTLADQAQALGIRPVSVLAPADVLAGINQARLTFPRCWFDAQKCDRLIEALAQYRAAAAPRMAHDIAHPTFKREPLHDWSSHAADAFRYMAVSLRDFHAPTSPPRPKARSRIDFSPFQLGRRIPERNPSRTDFAVPRP